MLLPDGKRDNKVIAEEYVNTNLPGDFKPPDE
jgi:hypothetical protein